MKHEKMKSFQKKLHSNGYPKIDGGMNKVNTKYSKCSSFLCADPKMSCLYVSQN